MCVCTYRYVCALRSRCGSWNQASRRKDAGVGVCAPLRFALAASRTRPLQSGTWKRNGQDGRGWAGGMALVGEVGFNRAGLILVLIAIDIKVPVCNCAFRVRWTHRREGQLQIRVLPC
ncbi:hypothetical protein ABW21_db0205567 [Orbilia brochopaga]|nr:hypothetical protein ABW21_db0205567 [Drechslerella brochopaga]